MAHETRAARRRGNYGRARNSDGKSDKEILAEYERGCKAAGFWIVAIWGPMLVMGAWLGW